MNNDGCCSAQSKTWWAAIVGIAGSFLIMGAMAWLLVRQQTTSAADAARAAERVKALAEITAANADAIGHYKMEDPNKGWVRLPVARAMEIVAQEWQDPAKGRESLLKRYQNSTNVVSYE